MSALPVATAGAPVPSPCINVCQINAATGWCAGCLRSLDEIAGWSRLDEAAKRAVWAQLPARRIAWARRVV
jgi:predicted Fe-S protein YdhL (DUF1289 family)